MTAVLVRAFAFQAACGIAIFTTVTGTALAGTAGDWPVAAAMAMLTLFGVGASVWGWRTIRDAHTAAQEPHAPPEYPDLAEIAKARQTATCAVCGPLACRCALIADETALGWTRLGATCCLTAWATRGDLHDTHTCTRKATP